MSNLLAAVGLAQLSKMDKILEAKKKVREFYGRCSEGKRLEFLPKVEGENNWLTIMLLKNCRERDRLIKLFEAENVETRPVWKPMHLQKVFNGCRAYGGKVSENLFSRGVCLASGAGLTKTELKRIAKVIDKFAAERK
jgi:dTDP-4-amino-4,6-dideoxygalactose transaminase